MVETSNNLKPQIHPSFVASNHHMLGAQELRACNPPWTDLKLTFSPGKKRLCKFSQEDEPLLVLESGLRTNSSLGFPSYPSSA